MSWLLVIPIVLSILLISYLFPPNHQEYPDWVINAFEEFEKEAEEDSKLSEVERIMKYFPETKITHEGNKTIIDLAGEKPEEVKNGD